MIILENQRKLLKIDPERNFEEAMALLNSL